jgi:hypothetical protein
VSVNRADILEFLRAHSLGVQASVTPASTPQAAVVGFIVTEEFELFFDTVDSTRKAANLRRNSTIAFVIGGFVDGDERTVQYEGVVDEPTGPELERLKERYFARFPDGRTRQRWPGILYLRVRPRWLRYSDFGAAPPDIVEFSFGPLCGPE